MSYTIEYNKQAFYIENEGESERTYFLFIRQGANNVREADSNLRAKDWDLVKVGSEKELWKYIGKRLGSIHGGGIQKATGWDDAESFTPEQYIRQYRSKIKNAKPLSAMLESFSVRPYIYMRDVFENQEDRESESLLRRFVEEYQMIEEGSYYYEPSLKQFTTFIEDVEGLQDFFLNFPKQWSHDWKTGYRIEKQTSNTYRRNW